MYGKWARQYETSLDPNDIIPDVVISNELPKVKETEEVEEVEEKEVEKETEKETAPKMDNRKLIREMARLGGTTFNIEADRIRDEAKVQEEESREQEDKVNAMFEENFKFGHDVAFVMNELLMANEEEQKEMKPKCGCYHMTLTIHV